MIFQNLEIEKLDVKNRKNVFYLILSGFRNWNKNAKNGIFYFLSPIFVEWTWETICQEIELCFVSDDVQMIKFRKNSNVVTCYSLLLLCGLALDFSMEFPGLQIVSLCPDLLQISNVTNFNIYLVNLFALNTYNLKYLSKNMWFTIWELTKLTILLNSF